MSDDPTQNDYGLTIPDETREKFSELVTLILGSQSMNTEERQYWINILPVMTPEQLKNLNDILTNEREQLSAIEQKYGTSNQKADPTMLRRIESDRKRKRAKRQSTERQAESEEEQVAENLLKQIEQFG